MRLLQKIWGLEARILVVSTELLKSISMAIFVRIRAIYDRLKLPYIFYILYCSIVHILRHLQVSNKIHVNVSRDINSSIWKTVNIHIKTQKYNLYTPGRSKHHDNNLYQSHQY